jgi:hypothetical protein
LTITDTIDLEEELPRRERRRLVTPVGVVAVAVAIAALGFLGGVQVQKSRGTDTPTGRLAGGFPGAGGTGAAAGRTGAGAQAQTDATIGEVSSVDGKTIYVDDATGNTLKVKLAKGGKVTRTATADADTIHPGDTVIVQGETASSGTVVASSIRATASNAAAAGGFGGGFGGATPGAGAAPGGGG